MFAIRNFVGKDVIRFVRKAVGELEGLVSVFTRPVEYRSAQVSACTRLLLAFSLNTGTDRISLSAHAGRRNQTDRRYHFG
jgi:hypothetical protein